MAFKIPSDWKLNKDGTYDVKGAVRIKNTHLVKGKFPVKFGQVGGGFYCGGCTDLTSLLGAPKSVGGHFDCWDCTGLKNLEGAPESVDGDFNCQDCTGLTSLLGAPLSVGGDFDCSSCLVLTSLKGIEHTKSIETFYLPPNLESHILGLFYTGCKTVTGNQDWTKIVNQYLPLGPKGASKCSIDLIKAGLKNLAQL